MNKFNLKQSLKKLTAYVLSGIAFPLNCISCGKPTYGIAICNKCISDFLENIAPKENRCELCGVQLISEKNSCLECREKSRFNHIESIFPIHPYVLWKKELLFAWKIANGRCFSALFAKLVYTVIEEHYKNIVVVPIPPRKGKIKRKGWDQIDELCSLLQEKYNISVKKLLERKTSKEQKHLTKEERIENLDKNYSIIPNLKELPQEVVLIDDIMTTGATLESCAKALKKAGVEKVHAITLFYVP